MIAVCKVARAGHNVSSPVPSSAIQRHPPRCQPCHRLELIRGRASALGHLLWLQLIHKPLEVVDGQLGGAVGEGCRGRGVWGLWWGPGHRRRGLQLWTCRQVDVCRVAAAEAGLRPPGLQLSVGIAQGWQPSVRPMDTGTGVPKGPCWTQAAAAHSVSEIPVIGAQRPALTILLGAVALLLELHNLLLNSACRGGAGGAQWDNRLAAWALL